ncbi:hypothetical protein GQ43DRAFT_363832 [Delitschia confertaspora ATCC 74209]|uniref:Nuclear matrix protein n=1 Tax=Delitschia confertaspora ATCC 74209 TaxID=1513339 RepID=A0A9P4JX53_9PLEO|nr:hypothetical protein GQ43DRAFT_363832 [Delitschia confertaspora ATCC 74209]
MGAYHTELARIATERLSGLLTQARIVKQQTTIDPPLLVSELTTGDKPLLGPADADETHKTAIEVAAKNVFYAVTASTDIEDPAFVQIWNLLDILQYSGDRDQCLPHLVFLLIEELLDSQSIEGCRIVFNYLESRRENLIAKSSRNKDLVILRSCNELLRRLSRAEDAVFCGRVYIFLFQTFPLGDKSSVNLRGDFHVENVTTFEEYLKSSEAEDDSMNVDTEESIEPANEKAKLEQDIEPKESTPSTQERKPDTQDIDALYPVFWSLQHAFSNPTTLFEEANFKEFQKGLEATIDKFKEVPKVIQTSETEGKRGVKRRSSDDQDESATTFNPKYLTSRDLFKLELSDLAFQRHILVQALILIDFLSSLTEKSKQKPYYVKAQKAMQYTFTLGEQQAEWASGIKNTIANYLRDGPDGSFYYRMVDTVLSRDKNWVRWKMENCTPFTRDRVPTKEFLEAKSGAQKLADSNNILRPKRFGGLNLEFLSNTQGKKGLERLKRGNRFVVPNVDSYVKEVESIELDLEMVTSEQEKRDMEEEKANKTWRALRIASKDKLSSFDRLADGKNLERLFQPATTVEATGGEDSAPSGPEDRDAVPPEQHQSAEEQRADQRSQVTTGTAAE